MERPEGRPEELHSESLPRADELEFLYAIDVRLTETNEPANTIFAFITEQTKTLLGADHAHILLRREGRLESAYSTTPSGIGQRLELSVFAEAESLTPNALVKADDVTGGSLLIAPIRIYGTAVGVLAVQSANADAFGPSQERALTMISARIAVALQRNWFLEGASTLSPVGDLIHEPADSRPIFAEFLQRILTTLQEVRQIEVTSSYIQLRRVSDVSEIEVAYSTNPPDIGLILRLDESAAGHAIRERRTIVLSDRNLEPEGEQIWLAPNARSKIVVPISLGLDDTVFGVLTVESSEMDAFRGFSLTIVEDFANQVKIPLAIAKLRADVTAALESRHVNDLLIALGDQTSNFIHRLNNYAGALRARILEMMEIWEDGGPDRDAYIGEFLPELLELADRTLEMPKSMRDFLIQGGTTLDINEAVTAALSSLDIPPEVSIDLKLAERLPELSLYSIDIVLQNLLQNALDAMPKGGILSVTTSELSRSSGGLARIVISDTGTGIPTEVLPHIFDLNFTTKRSKGRGLGLGLWWVRVFVLRAGGEISVDTSEDGTSVEVKIPFNRTGRGHEGAVD